MDFTLKISSIVQTFIVQSCLPNWPGYLAKCDSGSFVSNYATASETLEFRTSAEGSNV
jgi:hypothetical protein